MCSTVAAGRDGRSILAIVDEYRTPSNHCLECGYELDCAAAPGTEPRRAPQAGDLSICVACGHLTVFDAELKLREPTQAEILEVAGDETLLKYMKARMRLRSEKMTEHDLKSWPEFFEPISKGSKQFELRKNDRKYA